MIRFRGQESPLKSHVWKNAPGAEEHVDSSMPVRKIRFKEIAKAVKFTSNLFGKALSKRIKATILYATETGKSELYAKRLAQIFSHAFNVNVCILPPHISNIDISQDDRSSPSDFTSIHEHPEE